LRDVGTLPAGLSAFRSHPAVHLPVERRRLWKFHDLEGMDSTPSVLTVSKHMPICSFKGKFQYFQTLPNNSLPCICVYYMIWGSVLPSSQYTQRAVIPGGGTLSQP
jgi:hypothetical protein